MVSLAGKVALVTGGSRGKYINGEAFDVDGGFNT